MINGIYDRKLSISEILKLTNQTLFANIKSFFLLCLLFGIPITILNITIIYFLADNPLLQAFSRNDLITVMQTAFPESALTEIYKYLYITWFMSDAFLPLCIMSIALITDSYIKGNPLSMQKAFTIAFSKWPVYILFAIFKILLMTVSISIIIGPLLVYVYLFFAPYIMALNNINVVDMVKESYRFVKGRFFKVSFYLIFFSLLKYGISQFLALTLFWAPYPISMFATECLTYLFYIIFSILFLNLYYLRKNDNPL